MLVALLSVLVLAAAQSRVQTRLFVAVMKIELRGLTRGIVAAGRESRGVEKRFQPRALCINERRDEEEGKWERK